MQPSRLVLWFLASALLAGCVGDPPEDDMVSPPGTAAGDPQVTELDFADRFVVAGVDDPIRFDLEVPMGTELAEGLLTWDHPTAALEFRFLDDEGVELGAGWTEEPGRSFVTVRWPSGVTHGVAEVTATGGADVAFDLHVRLIENPARYGPIDADYALGPGGFAEINLNMVAGDYFTYDWSSDADVYFDVHWHRAGQTHVETESTSTSGQGEFTAPEDEVYSLLWANDGVATINVEAMVDGVYQLHSMSR